MTPDAPDVAEMVAFLDAEAARVQTDANDRQYMVDESSGRMKLVETPAYKTLSTKAAMLRAIAERLRARGGEG